MYSGSQNIYHPYFNSYLCSPHYTIASRGPRLIHHWYPPQHLEQRVVLSKTWDKCVVRGWLLRQQAGVRVLACPASGWLSARGWVPCCFPVGWKLFSGQQWWGTAQLHHSACVLVHFSLCHGIKYTFFFYVLVSWCIAACVTFLFLSHVFLSFSILLSL